MTETNGSVYSAYTGCEFLPAPFAGFVYESYDCNFKITAVE